MTTIVRCGTLTGKDQCQDRGAPKLCAVHDRERREVQDRYKTAQRKREELEGLDERDAEQGHRILAYLQEETQGRTEAQFIFHTVKRNQSQIGHVKAILWLQAKVDVVNHKLTPTSDALPERSPASSDEPTRYYQSLLSRWVQSAGWKTKTRIIQSLLRKSSATNIATAFFQKLFEAVPDLNDMPSLFDVRQSEAQQGDIADTDPRAVERLKSFALGIADLLLRLLTQ